MAASISNCRRHSSTKRRDGASKVVHGVTVAARYRAAVAAVHGQMRFIGFPSAAAGQRPNVGVQELFVPLRLATGGSAARVEKPGSRDDPGLD